MAYVEIGAVKKADDNYRVFVSTYIASTCFNELQITMTREELKELRNMMHNALFDLNQELNYEQ